MSRNFPKALAWSALALLPSLCAQDTNVLSITPPPRVTAKRGETFKAVLALRVKEGYHVTSNSPTIGIPLRLTWETKPFESLGTVFPKPKLEKYGFSPEPVSIFSGDFEIQTTFKTPASALRGPGILIGTLQYQACTENLCLNPKKVEVRLSYEIR